MIFSDLRFSGSVTDTRCEAEDIDDAEMMQMTVQGLKYCHDQRT